MPSACDAAGVTAIESPPFPNAAATPNTTAPKIAVPPADPMARNSETAAVATPTCFGPAVVCTRICADDMTVPMPKPVIAVSTTAIQRSGRMIAMVSKAAEVTASAGAGSSVGSPVRDTTRPLVRDPTTVPAVSGSIIRPDCATSTPCTSRRKVGKKNTSASMAPALSATAVRQRDTTPRRNRPIGNTGAATERSRQSSATPSATMSAITAPLASDNHGRRWPTAVVHHRNRPVAPANNSTPAPSSSAGASGWPPLAGNDINRHQASADSGRLMMKSQRQLA